MYLNKKLYLYKKSGVEVKGVDAINSEDLENLESMTFEAGYWRKANHIHKWFVDNVQDGVDDCKEYDVSREQLKELLELCKKVKKASELVDGKIRNGWRYENNKRMPIIEKGKVIKNPKVAKEFLPTEEGFFFGSYDYDEYYIKDIDDTIEILEKALASNDGFDFTYSSSW